MKRNMKLTKKDADIVALKNFLPERKFNETVIKILRAAAKDRVAVIPMEFEIVPFEKHPGTKIYHNSQRFDQAVHPSELERGTNQKNNRRSHIRLVRANT